ncbi:hypothetical protein Catovirus_1_498 [Catovirus CTV1]|uniref:Uncharacterized protein n=1 Tax=Catovirus CTV1 TaxID=1977631 RepID=A0A1V0S9W6_9VIRU|nr:hypothetical protein Catovirus_1_498 [Catovirus CTV1]
MTFCQVFIVSVDGTSGAPDMYPASEYQFGLSVKDPKYADRFFKNVLVVK